MSLGEGFGVGFRWVGGGWWWFFLENEGKGEGGGQAKEPASQCAHVCQNYPLVSPRNEDEIPFHDAGLTKGLFPLDHAKICRKRPLRAHSCSPKRQKTLGDLLLVSETGRIWFRGVSSSQPIICV